MSIVAEHIEVVEPASSELAQESSALVTNKPRVLVVCPRIGVSSEVWLWRQLVGFSSIHVAALCWEHVSQDEFPLEDIHVFKSPQKKYESRVARGLKKVADIRDRNFYAPTMAEEREIEEIIDEFAPRAILCQYGYTALRMLRAARKCGVPLLVHFHGHDASAMLQDPWYRLSIQRALPLIDGVIVVAQYQYAWAIRNKAPIGHTHLIPCGVPVAEFELSRGPEADACKFLTVGRFVEKKGVFETIRAFAYALQAVPGIELEMIGDGPLLESARQLARELGVQEQIRFRGACPPSAVKAAMQESSVFVQHSVTAKNGDREGWPVAIAEAMASGLPIISTRHAGIPDQVDHCVTGILTEEGGIDATARAMAQLAKDKKLRESMGKAARQVAVEHFDTRRQISCLERAILCVIAEKFSLANPAFV